MTSDQEISTSLRRWVIFGFISMVGIIGVVGGWMAFASISGAIIAPGTVSVETNIKTVQHLEGGIVGEIHVSNGDTVSEGEILLRLDDTVANINLAIVNDQLYELYADNARLETELDGGNEVVFPESLLNLSDLPDVEAIMQAQRGLLIVRRDSRNGQVELLNQTIYQLNEEIGGVEAQRTAQIKQSELIKQEIESLRPLQERGLVSQQRILSLEREAARLEGIFGDLTANISRAHGQIKETELQISQLDKEFHEEGLTSIRNNNVRISELEERRLAFNEQLRHIDIRAPQAGRVHNLEFHTIGGVISPATPILQIIPINDVLIIDARVNPINIDEVTIGQEAVIRLSAFNSRTTPELKGSIIGVSPERIIDTVTGEAYFNAEVEISEGELSRLEGKVLVPGMPAEVFIRTSERTVWSYLIKPFTDQLTRAFREE
jgi:HlyD family secretion protein